MPVVQVVAVGAYQVGGLPGVVMGVAFLVEASQVDAFLEGACLVGEPLEGEHQAGTPMVGVFLPMVQEEGAFQARVEGASLVASLEEEHVVEGAFQDAIPEGAPLVGAFLEDTLRASKVQEMQDKLQ